MTDSDGFRYPLPTASPLTDWRQYIPLLLAAVDESLDRESVWEEEDALTALGYIEDLKVWLTELNLNSVPIGGILPYAGVGDLPSGYLICDGAELSQSEYASLYAVVGDQFGTANAGFFKLPNLLARFPLGYDAMRPVGTTGGAETHTLSIDELPAHTHQIRINTLAFSSTNGQIARGDGAAPMGERTSMSTGGGLAHNNMPPFLALSYIIRVE